VASLIEGVAFATILEYGRRYLDRPPGEILDRGDRGVDAGLNPGDVDGMLSYNANDSVPGVAVAEDLGIRLDFWKDTFGGGASTEALVGMAIGLIEVGMCQTVVIFRGMNGYSESRMGGGATEVPMAAGPVMGSMLEFVPYGYGTPAQLFNLTFARHMFEYGTTNEQVAMVKVFQSEHATANPKALYGQPVTVDDVLSSRWIAKPATHLLDCCMETNNGTAVIVTSTERARDLRNPPIRIQSVLGRVTRPFGNADSIRCDPITRNGGRYAAERIFGRAGVSPGDIQLTSAYDAFTFVPVLLFEAYGFCEQGAGGDYVSSGITRLGAARPNNTSGGQLCEGYSHGMNLVIENVRQIRHDIDDSCVGAHSYDYSPGGCRQVRDVELAMCLAYGATSISSSMIMSR
jgi:acetyl-CoA acetyltransferase